MDMDGNGAAFRDSQQDLDTMRRYEAFLQLQLQADGMTDAEYLAALDSISEGRDEFLSGAYSYGSSDEEQQKYRQAVADATGREDPDGKGRQDGVLTGMDGITGTDVTKTATYGTGELVTSTNVVTDPEAGPEADPDGDPEKDAEDQEQDAAYATDGSLAPEAGDGAWDGSLYEGAARYAASLEHGGTGDTEDEKDGLSSEPEFMEKVAQPVVENASQPGMAPVVTEPEAQAGKQYTDPSYLAHEDFQVHDVFDQIAAGTGLAGAVITYEYIPPQEIPSQPEQGGKAAPEYGPNMTALKAQLREMDGTTVQTQPEGPAR